MGQYENEAYEDIGTNSSLEAKMIPEVDALNFITNPEFLGVDLRPWQSIQIKTFYNLWQYYPPTTDEANLLKVLESEWRLKINVDTPQEIHEMILADGRRSGKSALMSFLAAYEVYSLICKYDPQEYYGILSRNPIFILHVAVSGDQADDMFQYTKNRMRSCPFFKPYFDWTKYNESEMRIFTPFDLHKNDLIKKENDKKLRGEVRQALLEGSITVQSVTTKAATKRGKAIKLLIFSEFAHFARPKIDSIFKEERIGDETQQTDYAMWKALAPSVKDFGDDGRVLYESSPREKGGQFYQLYCEAGGMEQQKPEEAVRPSHMALLQLATWQCNPNITKDMLDHEFRKDPVGSNMEYGARFGSAAGNAIPEEYINLIPQPNVNMSRICDHLDYRFVISVDPGGTAKKKIADTYVVSWGHFKLGVDEYWLDGFQAWDEQVIDDGGGSYQKINVDPNDVVKFILDLSKDIGKNFIMEIVYDQWNSAQSISTLQRFGLPAIETFYTNKYKADMYGNFLGLLPYGKIKSYGVDVNGYLERWKTELKYLQKTISGGVTYYSHPSSGPVLHDDFADSAGNLIYRLSMLMNPTKQSLDNRLKHNLSPVVRPRQFIPVVGGSLANRGGGRAISGGNPAKIARRIKDR